MTASLAHWAHRSFEHFVRVVLQCKMAEIRDFRSARPLPGLETEGHCCVRSDSAVVQLFLCHGESLLSTARSQSLAFFTLSWPRQRLKHLHSDPFGFCLPTRASGELVLRIAGISPGEQTDCRWCGTPVAIGRGTSGTISQC